MRILYALIAFLLGTANLISAAPAKTSPVLYPAYLQGLLYPVVTPYKNVPQKYIDWDAYEALVALVSTSGATAVVAVNDIGQRDMLSYGEKEQLIKKTLDIINGSLPVLVGIGGKDDLRHMQQLIEYSERNGAAGFVITLPSYLNTPVKATSYLSQLCTKIAGDIIIEDDLGIITPAALNHLLDHNTNIKGIRNANAGNATYYIHMVSAANGRCAVLAGPEPQIRLALMKGAVGIFSACASVCPHLLIALENACYNNNTAKAAKLQARVTQTWNALNANSQPGRDIKIALKQKHGVPPYTAERSH